jgi:AcrR family transcriptional regulator
LSSPVVARIVQGALACYSRYGLAKTTMDDVAAAAGVSRATLYRNVASKDALVRLVLQTETARIAADLAAAIEDEHDVEVALAVVFARLSAELAGHEVLNKLLETEPEVLLPLLTTEAAMVLRLVRDFVDPLVERGAATGQLVVADRDAAVEYVARTILTYALQPSAAIDAADPAACADFVRHEVLGGLRA